MSASASGVVRGNDERDSGFAFLTSAVEGEAWATAASALLCNKRRQDRRSKRELVTSLVQLMRGRPLTAGASMAEELDYLPAGQHAINQKIVSDACMSRDLMVTAKECGGDGRN